MNDDELGRRLTGLVPDPQAGYWEAVDRALKEVAEGRPVPLPAVPEAATGGRRWSRVLMVAAAITVALAVAGGLLAARPERTQITSPADQTVSSTTVDSTPSPQTEPMSGPGPSGSVADRAPIGAIVVNGDPLAAFPSDRSVTDAGSEPAYGQVAPGLTGTDFDGTEVRIQPDGRRKAIVLVAHWCPHCQPLLATLSQLVDQQRVPEDLDLYVVSTHYMPEASPIQPQNWPILDELRGQGVRILRDDGNSRASAAYAEGGFPTIVYLDGGDRVVARSAGELDTDALAGLLARTSGTTRAVPGSAVYPGPPGAQLRLDRPDALADVAAAQAPRPERTGAVLTQRRKAGQGIGHGVAHRRHRAGRLGTDHVVGCVAGCVQRRGLRRWCRRNPSGGSGVSPSASNRIADGQVA